MALTADRIDELLRPHRKELVMAAEKVVQDAGDDMRRWNKTQLPLLASVAGEAACPEEIANFLRYQSKRQSAPWPAAVAQAAIAGIAHIVAKLRQTDGTSDEERDRLAVAAWRLYATYMTRAYTYLKQSDRG
jgi:hypothetical protein